ncbi:hypothetical protein BaRGS_00024140 [Batillaria attramentaria]|uniref:Uncharacterized protein n=1 Tax=Batillaria attramentaria TaxID=370345 RepID=A0ABD0KBV3_9CAEN
MARLVKRFSTAEAAMEIMMDSDSEAEEDYDSDYEEDSSGEESGNDANVVGEQSDDAHSAFVSSLTEENRNSRSANHRGRGRMARGRFRMPLIRYE